MKKNKKLMVGLIVVIGLMWVFIIYKFIGITGASSKIIDPLAKDEDTDRKSSIIDTFSLVEIKRDPFLGYIHHYPRPNKQKKKTRKIEKEKPKINWSFISYGGLVQNMNTNESRALVNINQRPFLLSKGEEAGGIKILTLSEDSIRVAYKKEEGIIKK